MKPRHDILIIGGGQAAGNLIQALQRRAYQGDICLVSEEDHPPYERPPLSKAVLTGEALAETSYLDSRESFESKATLVLGQRVVALNTEKRSARLADGREIAGRTVVLSTGARPRTLDLAGSHLPSIHHLRNIADCLALKSALQPGRRLALIGGGTIGLEVASAAIARGLQVTVIEAAPRLLPRLLPEHLSAWLSGEFTKAGVDLLTGRAVRRLIGQERVEAIELHDDAIVQADLVLCGIGVQPNSELAIAAGLAVENGILVDGYCETSVRDIFAIGDVASRRAFSGEVPRRLESWDNALQQADRLADRICGLEPSAPKPCWFWTDLLGRNIQVLGEIPADSLPIFRGDPAAGAFTVIYHRGSRLVGAIGVDRGRDIRALREIMGRNLNVPIYVLADPATRLDKLVRPEKSVAVASAAAAGQ
jgi:NAD(P)H-nitrite reductase large subunit